MPCRFIPLTKDGQTLEDLYRTGNQVEMEEASAEVAACADQRIERERGISAEGRRRIDGPLSPVTRQLK